MTEYVNSATYIDDGLWAAEPDTGDGKVANPDQPNWFVWAPTATIAHEELTAYMGGAIEYAVNFYRAKTNESKTI